jgi:hypothetical protein
MSTNKKEKKKGILIWPIIFLTMFFVFSLSEYTQLSLFQVSREQK